MFKVKRILFSAVVMVLPFGTRFTGSNPARTLYFCHELVHPDFVHSFVKVKINVSRTDLERKERIGNLHFLFFSNVF